MEQQVTNGSIRIGTRGSELALWQARETARLLPAPSELAIIKTAGDRFLNMPLQGQLEKGFFTTEIEDLLLAGEIDAAVHSLKDLPVECPAGLAIGAYLPRAPVSDLLLVNPAAHDHSRLIPLKDDCIVGATSLRRQALLKLYGPHCNATMLRGNVPTRISKCRNGEFDAIILARAGVERLNLDTTGLHVYDLNPEIWLPAPGQGAIAVQSRSGDERVLNLLTGLDDTPTRSAVELERRLLANFEGGCHTAFGAWARPSGDQWQLLAGIEHETGWQHFATVGSLPELVTLGPASDLPFAPYPVSSQEDLCRPVQ